MGGVGGDHGEEGDGGGKGCGSEQMKHERRVEAVRARTELLQYIFHRSNFILSGEVRLLI